MTMMQLVVLLLVAGIILLVVEMFLAGADFGISGILGIAAIGAAGVILVIAGEIIMAIVMAVLVVAGVVAFIKIASKRGLFKKLIMDEALSPDVSGVVDLSGFAGKSGVALTAMRPIGTVDFGGVPVEAYSDGSFIDAGEEVIVTNFQDTKLFVRPLVKAKADKKTN